MDITQVETPCIIVNERKLDANIRRMSEAVAAIGVGLRPHTKTHKMPAFAKRQMDAGAVGITVAKLAEAEVMARDGLRSIFIAYPIVTPSKLERAVRLSQSIELILTVDSLEGARRLSAAVGQVTDSGSGSVSGHRVQVRLEVDSGLHRTGVKLEQAVAMAKEIHKLPGLQVTGICTYRSSLLQGKPTLHYEEAGQEEGELMARLAEDIRQAGVPIRDVSVGSSPTGLHAGKVKGVTEIRPGTYVFQDRMQAAYGLCSLDDCAAYVLATVVSRPSENLAIIDGGSKTFATDVQPGLQPLMLEGFGHFVATPGAVLARMNEEHGMVQLEKVSEADKKKHWKIGDQVAVIPNHICSTINLHNQIYLHQDGKLEKMNVEGRGMLT